MNKTDKEDIADKANALYVTIEIETIRNAEKRLREAREEFIRCLNSICQIRDDYKQKFETLDGYTSLDHIIRAVCNQVLEARKDTMVFTACKRVVDEVELQRKHAGKTNGQN